MVLSVKPCPHPHRALKARIMKMIGLKRQCVEHTPLQPKVDALLRKGTDNAANMALVRMFAACRLPPYLLENYYFRETLIAVAKAGSNFEIPDYQRFGLDSNNSGKLGDLLAVAESQACAYAKEKKDSIRLVKGTLAADGAKNRNRDAINTVLMSSYGRLFLQSTEATGKQKDADDLMHDIELAIASAGGTETVFAVCMDGASACMSVLAQIEAKYPKIFAQRCSTHAWSLLMKDIGKVLNDILKASIGVVKFIISYSFVYTLLAEQAPKDKCKPLALFTPVKTRFGSTFYAVERLLKDADFVRDVFFSRSFTTWLAEQSKSIKTEGNTIKKLVLDDRFWRSATFYCKVQEHCANAMRLTDSECPNLIAVCHDYELAYNDLVAFLSSAVLEEDLSEEEKNVRTGLSESIKIAFVTRKKDLFTPLARAAAHINVQAWHEKLYDIAGADEAMDAALRKYYGTELQLLGAAKEVLSDFTNHVGIFNADPLFSYYAQSGHHQMFWLHARREVDRRSVTKGEKAGSCDLFVYLAHAYSGQGASERMNKLVTMVRTNTRNRQSHKVTSAYANVYMHLESERKCCEYVAEEETTTAFLDIQKKRILRLKEHQVQKQRQREAARKAAERNVLMSIAQHGRSVDSDDDDSDSVYSDEDWMDSDELDAPRDEDIVVSDDD